VVHQVLNLKRTGLLMRPKHTETKAETETETKKLLWDRDQKLRDRDRDDQYGQFNCTWKV